jgi:hypothetical protein
VLTGAAGQIRPVAGATVEFIGSTGRVAATADTDGAGYYRADLPAGLYTYVVHKNGFLTENAGRAVALRFTDGVAVCDLALMPGAGNPPPPPAAAPPPAKLGGRVYERGDNGKLIGVSGAVICFRPAAGGAMVMAFSDRAGAGGYEIAMPAGSWRASVRADGFDFLLEERPIDVSADTVTGHDFVLTRLPAKKSQ